MKIIWTVPADTDRDQIVFYIAQDNPDAAINMDEQIEKSAKELLRSPRKGRRGRVQGTREWVFHRNYILVYQYDEANAVIYIVAVLHSSRQWPSERVN